MNSTILEQSIEQSQVAHQSKFQEDEQERQKFQDEIKKIREENNRLGQELLLKQREYNIINNMNSDQLNELLLHQDKALIKQYLDKEKLGMEQIQKDKELIEQNITRIVNQKHFDQRLPLYEQNQINDDVYKKLSDNEVYQLHKELKQKKQQQTFTLSSQENFEKLHNQYHQQYKEFLLSQPGVEKTRQNLLKNMRKCQERMSILQQEVKLEDPKLSNIKIDPKKQEEIDKYIENKLKLLDLNKEAQEFELNYDLDSLDNLTHKVDKYLISRYQSNS